MKCLIFFFFFVTLANGQQVCISNCRRQHRTSVTSHLSHFEPMPTIHEEDDLDVGSFTKKERIERRKQNFTVMQHTLKIF
ncbi:unnamed protein product [Enterobius vermicularis]|uniref:Secreted protein n=1 Tax=Enterobius vermicularis TaxID=51028 RepID=A0A0N4VQN6_ENTVE|nr:unnamed protein product [Enterobius vermicularis]